MCKDEHKKFTSLLDTYSCVQGTLLLQSVVHNWPLGTDFFLTACMLATSFSHALLKVRQFMYPIPLWQDMSVFGILFT